MSKGDFTKAKEITPETRKKVLERQHGRSISGSFLAKGNTEYHHFLERSSSGIGYEWNIVAITSEEHRQVHDGVKVGRFTNEEFKTLIRNHLILHYLNWSEDKCKYHKYWKEHDYGIMAIAK